MTHITGPDRSQTLLLPETLDDQVAHDNPVRFSEAIVDGLELAAAGFAQVPSKPTGRPGFVPETLARVPQTQSKRNFYVAACGGSL